MTIPVDKVPAVLAGAPTIAQLYGVAPVDTVFCPPAKVTVPNADPAKLPAGTDVEFLILNVETIESWGPYGEWQKVSDGKVSADGKTITTTEGCPCCTSSAFARSLEPPPRCAAAQGMRAGGPREVRPSWRNFGIVSASARILPGH